MKPKKYFLLLSALLMGGVILFYINYKLGELLYWHLNEPEEIAPMTESDFEKPQKILKNEAGESLYPTDEELKQAEQASANVVTNTKTNSTNTGTTPKLKKVNPFDDDSTPNKKVNPFDDDAPTPKVKTSTPKFKITDDTEQPNTEKFKFKIREESPDKNQDSTPKFKIREESSINDDSQANLRFKREIPCSSMVV